MPKYTKKIIKKGGSGLPSRKSMRNLNNSQKNSPKTTGKRPRSPSQRSPSPSQTSNKKTLTLTLKPPDEKITEVLNYEKKDKEERDEYMENKNKSITKRMRENIKLDKYLRVEDKDKGHKVNQTEPAAEEVSKQWNAERDYNKASKSGVTASPFKSPTKNKNTTIFGFPDFSPIQGSPLPILSPQSSSKKPRTSTIFKNQVPVDLFPLSQSKGGKKHRKKTFKSYKMKKTNRNKNRKSRRNSKRNSKKNKK